MSERVAPAELLAVLKDDAYGHGLDEVLDVFLAEGMTKFGTLDLSGAARVRERAPDAHIFAWVFDQHDDLAEAIRSRIDLGVTDPSVLERVAEATLRGPTGPAHIHLKVDTGLHRAGVRPEYWPDFVNRAAELQNAGRVTVAGLWTHLAEESDADDSRSIAEFREAVLTAEAHGIRGVTRHVAASAAAFERADARFDLVRIGAFLYGIAPGGGIGPAQLGLRPAMTLQAPILRLHRTDGRELAEFGLGGASGILADAAGAASVALAGRRYPIVAVEPLRTLIDVTGSGCSTGDTVTLFGDGAHGEPTLQEWADALGTIGEEIVVRLSSRIPRRYVDA